MPSTSPEAHMNQITPAASGRLTNLRIAFRHLSQVTFKTLYTVNVRPILEFAAPIINSKLGDIREVEAAVQRGARVDQLWKEGEDAGRAALHHAAAAGHFHVVQLLLDFTANINIKSAMSGDDGGTPLHVAAEAGHPNVIKVLVRNGADCDAHDNRGRSAVHWAALQGQVGSLQALKDTNCDIHATVDGKSNALHFAAASGEIEAVEWLVQAGVNKNQKDKSNKTPSDIAKTKGEKKIYAFLKDKNNTNDVKHRSSVSKKGIDIDKLEEQLSRLETEKDIQAEDINKKNSEITRLQDELHRLQYEKAEVEAALSCYNTLDNNLGDSQHQLQIITHQNKEYRKMLNQQQIKEAELLQKNITNKQTIEAMDKEVQRLTQELRNSEVKVQRLTQELKNSLDNAQRLTDEMRISEAKVVQGQKMDSSAASKVTALKKEVDYLTYILNETGSLAINTQEFQQQKISDLTKQNEANKKVIADLLVKLRESEKNVISQSHLKDKEKYFAQEKTNDQLTISTLRAELDRLYEKQQRQQQAEATFKEQEGLVRQLLEQDVSNMKTINDLKQQLTHMAEILSENSQKTSLNQNLHQRTVTELLEQEQMKNRQIDGLNKEVKAMANIMTKYEESINSYQIQLENKEKEIKDMQNGSQETIASLQEKVNVLTQKLDAVQHKVYKARVRHASICGD
ncbi:uncharacterized protein MCAP_0864 [Cherax quadricarinatus]